MSDIIWVAVMFLLGTGFGLALAEIFAYMGYRARYSGKTRKNKKRDALQPLLGVVLPPEEKK
jgi:hypothetical protein